MVKKLAEAVLRGERPALARAITLAESRRPDHKRLAHGLLDILMPHTGGGIRVGISGVPGVGKSTTIESLGTYLVDQGHKVAVLAVDPSSTRSGGAILGDKTRMEKLSMLKDAYIRPSPSSGTLGGVAAKTREAMLLCEAAGFDVILVETVGVGQSETAVSELTDFFLVLMLPGAGDELQGIKKGILEMADLIAINKVDQNEKHARTAIAEYRAALHIISPTSPNWYPPVMSISGLTGKGLDTLWDAVLDHRRKLTASGEIQERRRIQDIKWMWTLVYERLHEKLHRDPDVRKALPTLENAVKDGTLSPNSAANQIIGYLGLE
ncbi:MAG: methylmalonyl Co-A mutase-associated GTPase MeaB [Methylobacteriaceae bacterium]|nr:methylmalonyl Co-A mutase-associated GTPase MeaB [Methylobacteriaceae bacterium]